MEDTKSCMQADTSPVRCRNGMLVEEGIGDIPEAGFNFNRRNRCKIEDLCLGGT